MSEIDWTFETVSTVDAKIAARGSWHQKRNQIMSHDTTANDLAAIFNAQPRHEQFLDDDDLRCDIQGFIVHRQSYGEPTTFGWRVDDHGRVLGNLIREPPIMGKLQSLATAWERMGQVT